MVASWKGTTMPGHGALAIDPAVASYWSNPAASVFRYPFIWQRKGAFFEEMPFKYALEWR